MPAVPTFPVKNFYFMMIIELITTLFIKLVYMAPAIACIWIIEFTTLPTGLCIYIILIPETKVNIYFIEKVRKIGYNGHMTKSILRYPGGKSRAVKELSKYIPQCDEMISPFFGGGSVEFHISDRGTRVYGYDVFEYLAIFWQQALSNPKDVADIVRQYHPLPKDTFYEIQKKQSGDTDVETAAFFYVLNRASFSGSTMSGGMGPEHKRFTESSIERLENFRADNVSVENLHFRDSIKRHDEDVFMYLDPPYLLEGSSNNLYGVQGSTHRAFEHEELFELIKDRPNWIMSYNLCDEITTMYDGFDSIIPEWAYGMSKDKKSKEVLIFAKNLEVEKTDTFSKFFTE